LLAASSATDQMPVCWIAVKPEPRFAGASPAPVPSGLRGATPSAIVFRHMSSARTTASESNVLDLPALPIGEPPPIHMNGYQVKFW
jgi:hypothetical protein